MTEQTNADQLADLFTSFAVGMNPTGLSVGIDSAYELGDHIASTWLAEHDAKVRAEALREAREVVATMERDRADEAERERDAALASIEAALRHSQVNADVAEVDGMVAILCGVPADALREHDAALTENLADEWHADNTGTSPRAYNWLREKARERREERA